MLTATPVHLPTKGTLMHAEPALASPVPLAERNRELALPVPLTATWPCARPVAVSPT
jgi:hypothetical protein